MNHTHKFKEIELSIDRLHSVTHWRCVECNEVWITDNGDEESLPGEILFDDLNYPIKNLRSTSQLNAAKKNGQKGIERINKPWRENFVLSQKKTNV